MKVKVVKDFKDKYTGERHREGDFINVSKERFDEILTVGELVEAVAEEVVETTEQPKKTTRKATKKPAK